MTQQLISQHLVAMGKYVLGTSVAKKIEAKRKKAEASGVDLKEANNAANASGEVVGAINLNSPVAPVTRSSVTEASQMCEATFGLCSGHGGNL